MNHFLVPSVASFKRERTNGVQHNIIFCTKEKEKQQWQQQQQNKQERKGHNNSIQQTNKQTERSVVTKQLKKQKQKRDKDNSLAGVYCVAKWNNCNSSNNNSMLNETSLLDFRTNWL